MQYLSCWMNGKRSRPQAEHLIWASNRTTEVDDDTSASSNSVRETCLQSKQRQDRRPLHADEQELEQQQISREQWKPIRRRPGTLWYLKYDSVTKTWTIIFLQYCLRVWHLLLLSFVIHNIIAVQASVQVRQCKGVPQHVTMSVGPTDAATEMIISFASISSHYPVPPVGGVLVTKRKEILKRILAETSMNNNKVVFESNNIDDELEDDIDDDSLMISTETEQPTSYNVSVPISSKTTRLYTYYSPYYHHVTITNLQPDTKYYYWIVVHPHHHSFDRYEEYTTVRGKRTNVKDKEQESMRSTRWTKKKLDNSIESLAARAKSHYATTTSSSTETTGMKQISGGGQHQNPINDPDEYGNRRIEESIIELDGWEQDDTSHHHFTDGRRLVQSPPYNSLSKPCPDRNRIRSFRTAPLSVSSEDETKAEPVTFAIVGDLGQFPHSIETLSHLQNLVNKYEHRHSTDAVSAEQIHAMILAGDIAYTGYNHRAWDTFFDFLDDTKVAERIPIQIVPGNHDIDKITTDERIFLAYEHRFRMPQLQPAVFDSFEIPEEYTKSMFNLDHPYYPLPYDWGNAYYSYKYGMAKFVMISAYSSMEPSSAQYQWIISEFQTIDRAVTPWLIVVIHTPVYNTFSVHHHDPQIIAAKEHLEPLFVEHRVNVVFNGHIHAYQRTTNVANGTVTDTGPIHITVGAGGRNAKASFTNEEPEPWIVTRDATMFGYGLFRIFNSSAAQWEFIHTGNSDDHRFNTIRKSNATLPSGPPTDTVFIHNQYFM